jgi:hypothetical protein
MERAHTDRALRRVAETEQAIADFGNLDAAVDARTIKQVRSGSTGASLMTGKRLGGGTFTGDSKRDW